MLALTRIAIAMIALLTSANVMAGDLQQGKEKALKLCQTCHGMDGVASIAMAPNISGQQKDYMMIQLEAYRDGKRQHPQMSIIAKSLSDEDIDDVSEWYSNIKISIEQPE